VRFLAAIAGYLGNGTRQTYNYYGSLIPSHRYPIDLCHFDDLE